MSEEEHILWGIHAGRLGDADSLFLKRSLIAIGWNEMGDITSIAPNQFRENNPVEQLEFPDICHSMVPPLAHQPDSHYAQISWIDTMEITA